MKLVRLKKAPKDAPPLSPPITKEEERWWAEARKPLQLGVVLQVGLPWLGVTLLGVLVAGKFTLGAIPFFLLTAVGMSAVTWRIMAKSQRDQAVRWKRIREGLEKEDDDREPLSSGAP